MNEIMAFDKEFFKVYCKQNLTVCYVCFFDEIELNITIFKEKWTVMTFSFARTLYMYIF